MRSHHGQFRVLYSWLPQPLPLSSRVDSRLPLTHTPAHCSSRRPQTNTVQYLHIVYYNLPCVSLLLLVRPEAGLSPFTVLLWNQFTNTTQTPLSIPPIALLNPMFYCLHLLPTSLGHHLFTSGPPFSDNHIAISATLHVSPSSPPCARHPTTAPVSSSTASIIQPWCLSPTTGIYFIHMRLSEIRNPTIGILPSCAIYSRSHRLPWDGTRPSSAFSSY